MLLVSFLQMQAQYCTTVIPTGCAAFDDTIEDFTIPAAGFSHLATGCSGANFGDFTSDSALQLDLAQTNPYDFIITHGAGGQWVKIWIDFDSDQVFDTSEEVFASTAAGTGTVTAGSFTIPTSVALGLTRMRVITIFGQEPSDPCTPMGTWGETHDYTVNILPPPACPAPTNVVSTSVQAQTADFSWDDVPNAVNGYNWEVYVSGDDPAVDTPVSSGTFPSGSTSGQVTGVSASTDYDFYLTSDCGATDGLSNTVGPFGFTTLCDVFPAPFSESFDGTAIPNCWSQSATSSTTGAWLFSGSNNSAGATCNGAADHTGNGGNYAWMDQSGDDVGVILELPVVDISALNVPYLEFYHFLCTGDYSPANETYVEAFDGSGWVQVAFINTGIGDWEEYGFDLSGFVFNTNLVQLRFRVESGGSTNDFWGDNAIDDVSIIEAPTCIKPSNLGVNNISFDSVDLGWDDVTNATNGYIWEVYTAGDDPATSTPVSSGTFAAGDTQGFADGLTPETDYDVYLIADCGATDGLSEAAGPLSFTTTPLCSLPLTFDFSNVLPDSVELTWTTVLNATTGYNWAVFNAGDDPATDTPVVSGTATSSDTSVVVTGLSSNTSYEAYITTDCGTDGTSDQSSALAFDTPCSIFVAPYSNGFENMAVTTAFTGDDCWLENSPGTFGWDVSGTDTPSFATGPNSAFSGSNFLFTESSSGAQGDEAFLVTPIIDMSALTNPALSFYYHMHGGDMGDLNIDVDAGSGYDLAVSTISGEQQPNQDDVWIQHFVDLTAYAGQTITIRFRGVRGPGFESDISIDDVLVDEAPSCFVPLNLTASNPTLDGADIVWDPVANATAGYIWSVFNFGDDPAVDAPVLTGTVGAGVTSTTITGLGSSTLYEVYVQADCGATDGLSDFSVGASFQTLCDVFVAPYFEDFSAFPVTTTFVEEGCWEEVSTGGFAWDVSTGGTPSGATGPDSAIFGNNYIFSEASTGATGDEAIVLTPEIDLSGLTAPALTFWYHMFGDDMGTLHVDVDDGTNLDLSVFSITGEQQTDNAEPWLEQLVDLSVYAGQTIQVRFRVERGPGFNSDVALDGVRFDEAPSCFTPVNLSVANITETTADFSWDDEATATDGYNWFVFNAGDDPDVDTPVASGSVAAGVNSVSISNLPSSSFLVFYVQSDCGASGTSFLSVPLTFETLCDVFPTPYFEDFSNFTVSTNFVDDGCWTHLSTTGFGWDVSTGGTPSLNTGPDSAQFGPNYLFTESSTGALGDEAIVLTPQVDLSNLNAPALSFWYHMVGGDMGTLHVDVDNGTNLDLSVFSISGPQQAAQADDFIEQFIDLSAYAGQIIQVRFRVERGPGFESDVAIDGVNFDEAPPCLKPTGLTLVEAFFDSADVSWSPVGNATSGYIWSVFNAGDDPATATPVSTGTFPAGSSQGTVTGLSAETDYDIYIESDCGSDGTSGLTLPISITTTPVCSVPATFEVTNILPDSAILSWSTIPNATNGYIWTVFNAGDDPATATPVATGTAGASDTSASVTGLSSESDYEAYITTDCGATDGQSDLSAAVPFSTPCVIFVAPYLNDFENFIATTALDEDDCWTEESNGIFGWDISNSDTPSFATGPNAALSGTNFAFTESSSGALGDEALLVSPLIDISALSGPALSFWYHMHGGDMGTLNVDIDAGSGFDLAVFSLTGQQQAAQTDAWIQQFVDLSAYAGQTIRIRFRGERGNGFESDISIDDVAVDEAPACLTPTGLATSNITANGVDISWSPVGNATAGYNWLVFVAGADPDVDTPVATGSVGAGVTSTTITGLNPATLYDVYIQSDCGITDGVSELSPAVSFQTLCATLPAPYFNDFETFVPTTTFVEQQCFIEASTGTFAWDVSGDDTPTANTGPNQAQSGTNFLYTEASSGSQGDEALLEIPSLDLSPLNVPALSFWYHMHGNDTGSLNVDVDAGSGYDLGVFTLSGEQQPNQNDAWVEIFVDLSAYSGQVVTIRFRGVRGSGLAGDMSIDDLSVDEAPTCFDPLALGTLSVSDVSADLTWTAGSNETVFDVEIVVSGNAPTGVPTFEDVSLPFTATGLTPETDYDFYVRADCGGGDTSDWVGPSSFTTTFSPVTVIVNDPAINETYCYDNSEIKEWLFTSSDGTTPVEIIFNAGQMEADPDSDDRFRVFDGFDASAPVIYDSEVDGVDLAGVQLIANSGTMYMLLEAGIFGSCQGGVESLDAFDFDVFAGELSTNEFSSDNFTYYPSPVKSNLTIESSYLIKSVRVFDMLGREVINDRFDNSNVNLNMQDLSSGTYIMKVTIGESSQTFRIIKE